MSAPMAVGAASGGSVDQPDLPMALPGTSSEGGGSSGALISADGMMTEPSAPANLLTPEATVTQTDAGTPFCKSHIHTSAGDVEVPLLLPGSLPSSRAMAALADSVAHEGLALFQRLMNCLVHDNLLDPDATGLPSCLAAIVAWAPEQGYVELALLLVTVSKDLIDAEAAGMLGGLDSAASFRDFLPLALARGTCFEESGRYKLNPQGKLEAIAPGAVGINAFAALFGPPQFEGGMLPGLGHFAGEHCAGVLISMLQGQLPTIPLAEIQEGVEALFRVRGWIWDLTGHPIPPVGVPHALYRGSLLQRLSLQSGAGLLADFARRYLTRYSFLAQKVYANLAVSGAMQRRGAGAACYMKAGMSPELVGELVRGCPEGRFWSPPSQRRACATEGCPFLANGDDACLGYCCGCCYKRSHGMACNYFHGWRCEQVFNSAGAPRNPPVTVQPGDHLYSSLSREDERWWESEPFACRLGCMGLGCLQLADWSHTERSILSQLLLHRPPPATGGHLGTWAWDLLTDLYRDLSDNVIDLRTYRAGEAQGRWHEMEGAWSVADCIAVLRRAAQ